MQTCPNTPRCPIFSGVLQGTQYTDTYKRLFCENGEEGMQKCVRFQVAKKVGKCPPKVLPNSTKSVNEIIAEMRANGDL